MLLSRSRAFGRATSSDSFTHGARYIFAPVLAGSLRGRFLLYSSVFPVTAAMSENVYGVATEQKTVGGEQAKRLNGSDRISQTKELGNLAVNIIPHILNLYCLKATPADYDIYAPNATFEDPLMRAKGRPFFKLRVTDLMIVEIGHGYSVKQIKSAFYSMPKIFSEGKIGEYWMQENETTPGNGEINIDNVQHYKVWGKTIDMKSLIKLQVKNGKVIRHEDLWDKHPLWTRQTVRVPLVGRATETWRQFNMLVTHTLMGFGKDPQPKT